MNIQGQAISHKSFGCGVITSLNTNIVTVRFPMGEKKFIYPDAFKQHLTLKDNKIRKYIAAQIEETEAEEERQRQLIQKEQERRQKLLNFTVTVNSHAVFDIAPESVKQVCKSCIVSTGRYLSGYSKGKPKIAERVKPNSACLLTERPTGMPEHSRRIVGAFMVKEDFFGEDSDSGVIEGHPVHRIIVPAKDTLLFWPQFNQNAAIRWGNTAFKYCSVSTMNHILAEMVQLLANTDQQDSALEFYRYFCKMNRLHTFNSIKVESEVNA